MSKKKQIITNRVTGRCTKDKTCGAKVLANSINKLGLANASTPMGAIEVLAGEIKDGLGRVAAALESVASAIEEKES